MSHVREQRQNRAGQLAAGANRSGCRWSADGEGHALDDLNLAVEPDVDSWSQPDLLDGRTGSSGGASRD